VLEYLSSTHETACFELIDPEDLHVELVHLEKPELRFIGEPPTSFLGHRHLPRLPTSFLLVAFTSYDDRQQTICRNPLEGFEKMKSFGFKVVAHEVLEVSPTSGTAIPISLSLLPSL